MSGASTGERESILPPSTYRDSRYLLGLFASLVCLQHHAKLSVSTLLLHHYKNRRVILTQ